MAVSLDDIKPLHIETGPGAEKYNFLFMAKDKIEDGIMWTKYHKYDSDYTTIPKGTYIYFIFEDSINDLKSTSHRIKNQKLSEKKAFAYLSNKPYTYLQKFRVLLT